ncbi:hypothetical protein CASFOL_036177 [Castilleja foliolosa]|uniref:DUF5082 domain-containing protein n=1 Tax=Castilleja foliolosa TaxID=1961234 RepID=A0ABD3BX62_9LAMI
MSHVTLKAYDNSVLDILRQSVTANLRPRKIESAQEQGYGVNTGDYSSAVTRHHKRSDNELGNGNVNIADQLTTIQAAIQALHDQMNALHDQVNAQFNGINRRLDEIEARSCKKKVIEYQWD